MDIADTRVCCSAARRWGRHTVNCRQNRKAEFCEICILTATVHKSVKRHCHTRWYTENQEDARERICGGGLTKRNHTRKHITDVFTVYARNFTLCQSVHRYKGQDYRKTTAWVQMVKRIRPRRHIFANFAVLICFQISDSLAADHSCWCIKLSAWHTGGLSVPLH